MGDVEGCRLLERGNPLNRRSFLAAGSGLSAALVSSGPALSAPTPSDQWQIQEGGTGKEVRWRDLPKRLEAANLIFMGEQHDDPQSHRVQLALLEILHKQRGTERLTLGMEMFERDGQTALNDYLAGRIEEAALGKALKLWSNYATDYRPMVEFAKANRVPVVGTNAPARIVRLVGKEGLSAVWEKLSPEDRGQVAGYVLAPENDAYFKRFTAVMGEGHGTGRPLEPATIRRIYEAQCLRDDTMAESISKELETGRTVLHINGSFHSDYGLGTAARVRWRLPLVARPVTLSLVPYKGSEDLARQKQEITGSARADYCIFVPDERPLPKE